MIELMILVVIIGILAAIGVPAYQKYVIKARMAEGYQNIGVITRKEIVYFTENKEFVPLQPVNPLLLGPSMVLVNSSSWQSFLPNAAGEHVFFSYSAAAGKTDASGTELNTGPVSGMNLAHVTSPGFFRRNYAIGGACFTIPFPVMSAASYGAVVQNSYDWYMFIAVGDLNGDSSTTCTGMVQLVEASPLTNLRPVQHAVVRINEGN